MSFRYLIAFSLCLSFQVCAEKQQVQISYLHHSDQDSGTGFVAGYNFFINENLAATISYLQSGDIEQLDNDKGEVSLIDQYNAVDLGAIGYRNINQQQYFYFGAGVSVVTASDSELLLESGDVSPYIKVGTGFKVSRDLSIDLGVNHYLSLGELNSAPAFYLGVNYSFGASSQHENVHVNKSRETTIPSTNKSTVLSAPLSTSNSLKSDSGNTLDQASPITASNKKDELQGSTWAIQLGAFNNELNAKEYLAKYHEHSGYKADLIHYSGYYKVVIIQKSRADAYALLSKNSDLKGFVVKLENKILQPSNKK